MYLTKDGRVQPEVEYTYDIKFDDEEILSNRKMGKLKTFNFWMLIKCWKNFITRNLNQLRVDNSGFLIRHGYITPENEPNYLEIVSRCHVAMPFATR